MLHYAMIMGLNHFADILLEMIYRELTRLSILKSIAIHSEYCYLA